MTDIVRQIITPYANRQTAIDLANNAGYGLQTFFDAYATTDPAGGGELPTNCWTNGAMNENVIALFVADPANYEVTSYPNRQCFRCLSERDPPLYPWVGTL